MKQNSSPSSFTTSDAWIILSPIEQSIKRKIESVGTPLKDWNVNIYRGVLTGCNEAFIISTEKRNEILANCKTEDERERTAELIRPILRGRDIKRYGYEWADLYLIATHNGYGDLPRVDINDYPAVKNWLDHGGIAYNGNVYAGYKQIAKRSDKGATPYNLRNCAYMDDFSKQQIVWIELSDQPKFALIEGIISANTVFFMTGEALPHILGLLNSKIITWYFQRCIGTTSGVGTNRWLKYTIEQIPLAPVNLKLTHLVMDLCEHYTEDKNRDIDNLACELYSLTERETLYINKTAIA